jgi:hypothetical protein
MQIAYALEDKWPVGDRMRFIILSSAILWSVILHGLSLLV